MNTTLATRAEAATGVARAPKDFTIAPPADVAFSVASGAEISTNDRLIEMHWVHDTTARPVDHVSRDAVDRLSERVNREPASSVAHANLGLMLLAWGDDPNAKAHLEAAVGIDPSHYGSLMGLARLAMNERALSDAEALYTRVLQQHPEDSGALIGLSQIARDRNDTNGAIALLRRIKRKDPRIAVTHYEIGMLLLKQGKSHEAIAHLKEASRQDLRSPRLHHAVGVAYALLGELQRAKRAFLTALNLAPQNKDTILALAAVYRKLRDFESATSLLRDEHSADDDVREALACSLLDAGHLMAAKVQFSRLIAKVSGDSIDAARRARALNNLGVTLMRLNEEPARTLSLFREAIHLAAHTTPIPLRNLATFYIGRDELEAARDVLAASAKSFPSDLDSACLFALLLAELGEVERAVDYARFYNAKYGESPEMLSVLAGLFADDLDDLTSAVGIVDYAISRYPRSPKIANNAAYVYLLAGDAARARQVIGLQTERPRELPTWTATRGLLEIVEGRVERGQALYEEAARAAFRENNRRLGLHIRQKMFLELARVKVREMDFASAKRLAENGLAVTKGKRSFRLALERILRSATTS